MNSSNTRMMVWAAMFSAFAVVAAAIVRFVPQPPIPFSLLPLVSILAGVTLGSRWGAMSMLVYVLLGLVGVPVFAAPPYGGFQYITQPTFGFLLGFIFAPLISGLLIKKSGNSIFTYLLAAVLATVVIYIVGLPYLYVILGGKKPFMALALGMKVLFSLDLVKAVIAAFLAKMIRERVLLR